MVFRTLVNSTTKRIPLIKFRKGGLLLAIENGAQETETTASTTATTSTSHITYSGPVIEDWELPQRFWRKPISEAEMDYINRGGPE